MHLVVRLQPTKHPSTSPAMAAKKVKNLIMNIMTADLV